MSTVKKLIEEIFVPIHPAGYPFIGAFLILTFILGLFLGSTSFLMGLVLSCWCIYFFRNPKRYTPQRADLVIAPADGRVLSVLVMNPPLEMGLQGNNWTRVSIFMNIFDVHVNRSPIEGKVIHKYYFPGSFVNASLDKASEKNERACLIFESKSGKTIGVVQIAGLIARRILCKADEGENLRAGQIFGIIRFGSRVDVWLPNPVKLNVLVGQRTIAGETILADFRSSDDLGEVRVE